MLRDLLKRVSTLGVMSVALVVWGCGSGEEPKPATPDTQDSTEPAAPTGDAPAPAGEPTDEPAAEPSSSDAGDTSESGVSAQLAPDGTKVNIGIKMPGKDLDLGGGLGGVSSGDLSGGGLLSGIGGSPTKVEASDPEKGVTLDDLADKAAETLFNEKPASSESTASEGESTGEIDAIFNKDN